MEQRIAELEIRFTEQQDELAKLSEVVYQQGKTIDRLGAEVAMLRKRLEGEPGVVDSKDNERPPHY